MSKFKTANNNKWCNHYRFYIRMLLFSLCDIVAMNGGWSDEPMTGGDR
jgi:hypothetical protein